MSVRRALTLALAPLMAGAIAVAGAVPANAAPAPRAVASAHHTAGSATVPIAGTANGVAQTGTLTINRFTRQADKLLAIGTLSLGGQNLGTVQVPVDTAASTAACPILHLDLGPLDLNLLGLQIHLNEVVLDITAQPGPGNLLGNLLCAVAHLLDGGSLAGLQALLNQILAILAGL